MYCLIRQDIMIQNHNFTHLHSLTNRNAMISFRTIFIVLMLSSVSLHAKSAHYRVWENEVSKAAKGLEICSKAYGDAMGYTRPDADRKKLMVYARKTCGTMRSIFDATMLTVRSNVNGIDEVLATFHQLGNAAFDEMEPKLNETPLDYLGRSLETQNIVAKIVLKLSILDGGM